MVFTNINDSFHWVLSAGEPPVVCDLVEGEGFSYPDMTRGSQVESGIVVTYPGVEGYRVPVGEVHP